MFAMAKVPLPLSLLKLGTKELEAEAVDMLKMVCTSDVNSFFFNNLI